MQRATSRNPLYAIVSRLWRDVSGISLIYVTVALPALMGCVLLAIDVGRLMSLQSSLQHAADSIALAAAGELDRQPDALERADRAIANLIRNPTIFATNVATIDGSSVTARYLKSLPANDALPITAANEVAADPIYAPSEARYVEITVNPVTFTTVFPATFIGAATNTAEISARAVAGFDAAACDFTPLFMCNPYEPATGVTDPLPDYGLYSHVQSVASKRRLISFKPREGGIWRPGDYGFLGNGPGQQDEDLGHLIASVVPKSCFRLNRLYTRHGDVDDIKRAFNVRFDLYEGGKYGRTEYAPGKNVRKGYSIGNLADPCNTNTLVPQNSAPTAMRLPRDSCFEPGPNSCSLGGSMGDGDWGGDTTTNSDIPDFEQYWGTNFVGKPKPSGPSGQYSNNNKPTRYDIYREEIASNLQNEWSNDGNGRTEIGKPMCSSMMPVDEPDRRIIYGAIINCRAAEMSGREGGPYQGVAFGKFFVTEPMDEDGTLWTELIDIVKPDNSTNLRDMVQLYR